MILDYRTVIARWLGPDIPKQYEGATVDNLVSFLGAQGYAIVPKALLWEAARQADRASGDPYEDTSDHDLAERLLDAAASKDNK